VSTGTNETGNSGAEYVDQDSEGTTQAPEGEAPTDQGPIEAARSEGSDGSVVE
jgi:hypothetical protein